jgi:hypothetical protein
MSVLIIGNGFDLNLGFPTSYKQFLNSTYFKKLLEEQNSIAEHLNSVQELNNWIDIENEFQKYSDKYNPRRGRLIPSPPEKIDVKNEYLGIVNALISYLNSIDYSKYKKDSEAFKLLKRINGLKGGSIIYDFNYTPSVSLILKELGQEDDDIFGLDDDRVSHIKVHGSLEDRNIVFGVSDGCNIYPEHNFFRKSTTKNYPAINFTTELKYGSHKGNFGGITPGEIYIFGHSLGNMDYDYFKDFFTDVVKGPKREFFHFNIYYKGDNDRDAINDRLLALTDNHLADFKKHLEFIEIECR